MAQRCGDGSWASMRPEVRAASKPFVDLDSSSDDDQTHPMTPLPPLPRVTWDRSRITPGMIHFGVGGFHRAHQAVYLDDLMATGQAQDWGIIGVGTLPGDAQMRDALAGQDHQYTVVVKNPDGSRTHRAIGSIIGFRHAPDDREGVLALLADPAIRIVSLTITEGGYHIHPVTGELDVSDPVLTHDLTGEDLPVSVFAMVVEGLRRRRAAGLAPYTVMSCDNLPGNGTIARAMIGAFAQRLDPGLAEWIAAEVSFPNTMVDRITPATTANDIAELRTDGIEDVWPVVCEPFRQWVLEDQFPAGRPPWEQAGAQLVDDVTPYELMKLRLLNASHQAIACLGQLDGFRWAHEVSTDPLHRKLLWGYMAEEASPTLPPVPGIDLGDYRTSVIERFSNPTIADPLARLATDVSDRVPQFLLPVIHHNLSHGGPIDRSALVVAAWARWCEGTDESGAPIQINDRLEPKLRAAASNHATDLLGFLRQPDLFADLVNNPRFTTRYAELLTQLRAIGARATLAALV